MVKKKEKKQKDSFVDGAKTSEMSREQLEQFALRVQEEIEKEREERNYYQIERDKLRTYWELSKDQLEEVRAQLRDMDREMEEEREKNVDEIKLYKQRIKHLSYEHQNTVADTRAAEMIHLKLTLDNYYSQEAQLEQDITDLKNKILEQQLAYEENYKTLQLERSKKISKIRNNFELFAKELEQKYEGIFTNYINKTAEEQNAEITEVENLKNAQVEELINRYDSEFSELKTYYNDITLNNLALIANLKEQIDTQVTQLGKANKQLNNMIAEHKKIVEPMEKAKAEIDELKKNLENYEQDKQLLHELKAQLNVMKNDHEALKWEHETLELRHEQIKQERDNLQDKFLKFVMEVQQKNGLKSILLQKRYSKLTSYLEERDAMLVDVGKALNVSLPDVEKRVEQLLEKKDNTILDLQYELARITKMYDDLLQTYEAKLVSIGLTEEDLGFIPARISNTEN